jgi:hypothetical protein
VGSHVSGSVATTNGGSRQGVGGVA